MTKRPDVVFMAHPEGAGMTIKQYVAHLLFWIRSFPAWDINEHTTVGPAGGGIYYCLICGFEERDEE